MTHISTPHPGRRLAAVAALAATLALTATACAKVAPGAGPSASISTPSASATASPSDSATSSTAASSPSPSPTAASPSASPVTPTADQSILAQLPAQFVFASGAGGWATTLTMNKDGSFTGSYLDDNMGDTGADYPNGTVDQSNFTGSFVVTAQVSQDEYTLHLQSLTVQSPTGTSTIQNGTRYVYQDAYGFDKAQDFSLYLPGRATSDLPQAFLGWAQGSQGWDTVPATLPCWGLYNISGQEGFTSQND